MRVAILGGRGTVGGVLTKGLSSKYTLTSVTRDQVDLFDTRSVNEYFSRNPFDVVVNCAINSVSRLDAPPEVASDNLTLFANLYAHREKFGRVVHFCSGAEFDCSQHIVNAQEETLFVSKPTDPYGVSKNATARISYGTDNFYNLRLFGVFYPTELPRRLLPLILAGKPVTLVDKYFDYLYLEDVIPLVEYYINTPVPKYKDINVVYTEKIQLSDFVRKFIDVNNLDVHIPIAPNRALDYTGDGTRWQELDLPRLGQLEGMRRYIQ
jgi:nucleoside-diphosphate-sugar epimerase